VRRVIGTRAALVVLALAAAPASAADYAWPVVRVVDGDTVKVDWKLGHVTDGKKRRG